MALEDDVELVPLFTTFDHIFFLRLLQILKSKADVRNFSVFYFSFFEETNVLHQGDKRFEVVEIPKILWLCEDFFDYFEMNVSFLLLVADNFRIDLQKFWEIR